MQALLEGIGESWKLKISLKNKLIDVGLGLSIAVPMYGLWFFLLANPQYISDTWKFVEYFGVFSVIFSVGLVLAAKIFHFGAFSK